MWNVIVNGKQVAQILAWDRNDAWVYATRTFGMSATVERAS
jgi:hypothetical protein